jgi:serine/threonine protein kinase
MSRVSNKYELIEPKGKSKETLGEGAYGVVYKAKLLGSNGSQMFALKKIKVESENEGISSSALREITLLNQLDHENVIKLVDVEMIPDRLNLIFDLMEYDLKKDMDAQKHIPMRLSTLKVC